MSFFNIIFMKKEDIEKYSIWVRINNAIAGPYFFICLSYIMLFIVVSIFIILKPEIFNSLIIYYFIGIPLFFISLWITFIGSMLRDM